MGKVTCDGTPIYHGATDACTRHLAKLIRQWTDDGAACTCEDEDGRQTWSVSYTRDAAGETWTYRYQLERDTADVD